VEHGYHFTPAVNGIFMPFEDGSSIQLYDGDEALCEEEVRKLAPGDVEGFRAMKAVFDRCNAVIRADADDGDWVGNPPTHEDLRARLKNDKEACRLLFDWSIVEFVEYYLSDERLQQAYYGQGVIGSAC